MLPYIIFCVLRQFLLLLPRLLYIGFFAMLAYSVATISNVVE